MEDFLTKIISQHVHISNEMDYVCCNHCPTKWQNKSYSVELIEDHLIFNHGFNIRREWISYVKDHIFQSKKLFYPATTHIDSDMQCVHWLNGAISYLEQIDRYLADESFTCSCQNKVDEFIQHVEENEKKYHLVIDK